MLIVALVLAAVGLTALVTAVVTGNEVLAFICIAAAALGVVLMIVDAIRDRQISASASEDSENSGEASRSPDVESDEAAALQTQPGETSSAEVIGAEANSSFIDAPAQDVTAAGVPSVAKSAPAEGAVSMHEAATAAHHPTAEETYERFDEVDEEDEAHKS